MPAEQTILSYTITLDRVADLAFSVAGKQIYNQVNTSSHPWQLAIYLDSVLLNYAGGSGYGTDAPSFNASAGGVSAGSHAVAVTWYGHSTMQIRGVVLIIQGRKK